ncbi:MAG: hypothetical protein ACTSWN_00170 [Promethearchaeota archaeon]
MALVREFFGPDIDKRASDSNGGADGGESDDVFDHSYIAEYTRFLANNVNHPLFKRDYKKLGKKTREISSSSEKETTELELRLLQFSIESMICVHKSSFLMPEEITDDDGELYNLAEKMDDMDFFLLNVAKMISEYIKSSDTS